MCSGKAKEQQQTDDDRGSGTDKSQDAHSLRRGPGGGKGQYTSNHQYDPLHGVMPELHAVASIFWCKPGHRYPGGALATSFPGDYLEISRRLLRSWVRRRPDGVESAA